MTDHLTFILELKDMMSVGMQKMQSNAQSALKTVQTNMKASSNDAKYLARSVDEVRRRLQEVNEVRTGTVLKSEFREATAEAKKLERELHKLEGHGKPGHGGGILGSIVGGNLIAGGISRLASGAKDTVLDSIKAGMENDKTVKSFEVLTGSPKAGKDLAMQLRELKQTSIVGAGVYDNAKTLLGFGIGKDEIVRDMKMIGDVAMGDQEKMKSLTLAFAQARSAGKLMGQDLLQFINAGFNPLSVMSEKWEQFGFKKKQSIGELKKMMEQGKISSDEITKAFEVATSAGGKFDGMMEQIATTSAGKMMKMEGKWAAMQIDMGHAMMPVVDGFMEAAASVMHFLDISKTVPQQLDLEKREIDSLVKSITNLTEGNRSRSQMIDTLVFKFPELFSGIDKEKVKNAELLSILKDVNLEYGRKIHFSELDGRIAKEKNDISGFSDLIRKVRTDDLGVFDRIKLSQLQFQISNDPTYAKEFNHLKQSGVKENEAIAKILEKDIDAKLNHVEGLKSRQVIQEGTDLIAQAKELVSKPAANNKAAIIQELSKIERFKNTISPLEQKLIGDNALSGYDFGNLKRLLGIKEDAPIGAGGIGGSAMDTSTSDRINSGGTREINITIQNVVGEFQVNTHTLKEGIGEMETMVDESVRRALYSAAAAQ